MNHEKRQYFVIDEESVFLNRKKWPLAKSRDGKVLYAQEALLSGLMATEAIEERNFMRQSLNLFEVLAKVEGLTIDYLIQSHFDPYKEEQN